MTNFMQHASRLAMIAVLGADLKYDRYYKGNSKNNKF